MKLKRAAAVLKVRACRSRRLDSRAHPVVLSGDDMRRVSDFVDLLMAIDKEARVSKSARKQRTSAKTKHIKKGSPIKRAFNLSCVYLLAALSLCNHVNHRFSIRAHMLDTIVLTLTSDQFIITDPDKFSPSAVWVVTPGAAAHATRSQQNPTKRELCSGIYKPRLTLAARIAPFGGREIALKIDLSLPKLMFGNNFAELQYKDFAQLNAKLVAVLASMGISTSAQTLAHAPVCAIHYSKNIQLTDGSTPYHYINKIKEANITQALDVNQTEYRNDGHSYKWHCNSYEVAFYDKIKDLEKAKLSSKRAIEKDSELQLKLFEKFKRRKRKLEYLRMEVRLNKRAKIKQLFAKLGVQPDLTFKKLFKPAISKKVLLHYLDELESKRPPLLDYKPASDKALLVSLVMNLELNQRQALLLFGLKQALNICTPRELRELMTRFSARNWYRLMAEAHKLQLPNVRSPFKGIREQLEKFKPVGVKKIVF